MSAARQKGPLAPGSVIGIVGGGQLGRMLSLAAARLGFDVAVLAPETGSPAARVSAHEVVGRYDDAAALRRLADLSDVITFEFENLSAPALDALAAEGAAVYPPARALLISQDRLLEKTYLNDLLLETAPFAPIQDEGDIPAALQRLGAPCVLKARRDGYDGKGQSWIAAPQAAGEAFDRLGRRPAILEARVDFVRELSVIGARGQDGAFAAYPLGENLHDAGVLRRTRAPAQCRPGVETTAARMIKTLMDSLAYVGVLGLELFELADGRLLVNEFAPRVHNTGHWTLDGCEVDQFEQHVRAVAGWPLGPTKALASVEMTNLLGEEARGWGALSEDPSARLWLYGKSGDEGRRKMGHVNRLSPLRTN